MNHISNKILIFLGVLSIVFCQFKKDAEVLETFPRLNFGNTSGPLFSPDQMQMNHGFNFSMGSMDGKVFNSSSYTNSMSFMLKPNLLLRSNISIFQLPANFNKGGEIGYDLSLLYKPTENSLLQFTVQKLPMFYSNSYSPFSLTKAQ